jgi:putative Mg2+ transporter-C (MgtC) family protein
MILAIDPILNLLKLDESITWYGVIVRLVVATIFGGIVGLERQNNNQSAGFRTHIILTVASALAMLTNQFIIERFGTGDISRIGAGVVSGVGFLGAGTILITSRNRIKGLTTAAGLWACSCLGIAIGAGFYTAAICGLIIYVFALLLQPLESKLSKYSKYVNIQLEFDDPKKINSFIDYIREKNIKLLSLNDNDNYKDTGLYVYNVLLCIPKGFKKEQLNNDLKNNSDIKYFEFV